MGSRKRGRRGAIVVGVVAVGAVSVGAPVAVVTGVLGAAAIVGGAVLGVDVICNIENHNWNGLASDAGSLVGGALGGVVGGGALAAGVNGEPSPPWSLSSDWADRYQSNFPGGSVGSWMGKGPNPGSAGGISCSCGSWWCKGRYCKKEFLWVQIK